MTIAELVVKIGADASQFVRQMEVTKRQVATVGRAMESFGRTTTYAVTVPMLGMAAAALKMSASMEQTGVAFRSMLKDGNASAAMLKEIQRIAAETPFEFPELANSARLLLAYRFEASKIIPMLRTIGDAASAMGAGAEGIDRITRALGQMQAKGRVTAQEMLQLSEIGINGFQMIAEATGKSVQEIMKLSEKGMIDAATGVSAILSGINRQFGGAMEQQSRTLLGRWSTFLDDAKAALRLFGDQIAPIAKGALAAVSNAVKSAAENFAAMNIHEKNATIAMYAAIAAIPPMIMMIGKLIAAYNALKVAGLGAFAVGGPIAVGVAALAGLIYLLTKRWLEQKAALGAFNNEASATVIAMNGMTEGQQRLNLAFREGLLARYNEEYASLPSRASEAGSFQEWERAYSRRRQLELLIQQNEREVGAIKGVIGQRGAGAGGGAMPFTLPAGGAAPEMTAAQKREAEAMMERARLEAYTAYARSQIAGVHVSKAPGIWGLERWSAKPEPERVLTEREKRFRVARVLQDETVEKMEVTGAAAERFQSQFDGYVGSFTNWTNGFLEISDRMGNIASSIAMNWQNAGQIITNALRQMVAQLVGAIAKAMVFKALMTMFGIPTGGKGDLTFGGIIKSAFGFAEGGIVTKPTLALIGEKREPEAVIPLSKMGQFGGGTQTINIVLDGQVIASAVSNRQAKEIRMRGVLAA